MAPGTRLWRRVGAHADETQKNGDATLSESAKRRDRMERDSFFLEKLMEGMYASRADQGLGAIDVDFTYI